MRRRKFVAGSVAALPALRAADAHTSRLVPCINQVTTLGAAFDAECSAYQDAGFRHVELFDPVVQKADPAVTARTCYAAVSRFT